MAYYETVFMARQDLTDAQVKSMTDEFSKIITDNGGKIAKVENWGLLQLAYKINKAKKAHYVLLETDAPAPAVQEMERNMRINEDVIRSLTIRLDAPSEEPSPMMGGGSDKSDSKYDKSSNKEAA